MKFNTKVIHGGQENIDPAYNAVMPPIYQTTTFKQASHGAHQDFEYARSGNPTRAALEKACESIENGNYGISFSSGLAAIDAILKLLEPGDEVISTGDLYGGSYRLFDKIFKNFGIKFHFVEMKNVAAINDYINEKTKLVWIETPTNPMMNIIDIVAAAKITQNHNLLLAVDNTFATPYLQNPLDLGADIVMHSATKYLGGHSDVVQGCLVVNDKSLANKLYFIQNASGAVPGPQDCFLVLRGIKTLHVRMQRHCENGRAVAQFLKTHPKVDHVFWPGFTEHPNHLIAKSQMRDYGGMVSFTTKLGTIESAIQVIENLKVFTLAESLGGVESLAGHPATMTHASIPKEDREKAGIVDALIRLSVGIEDVDDLLEDLDQALLII
ncbi:cystathionine gamma-lyase [Nonlabens dokdonensis]|jgi:cystathionine beta-lyase|uniref:Cystathionine beta-lyase n=2 Tax=Nonlabens dokdonensis TaxID=328515 RepID=L7W8W7_NONDD|nr:PLP-dependent aspartate aminotransferase family protein [Nonlabens dokdonensis]AGC76256.1 cystathionine beta-lyase [Nonlabens dokdonensis DSW-6]PZX43918.1 cystathionine gamma-lyase [Nonlabens dokdonensis]